MRTGPSDFLLLQIEKSEAALRSGVSDTFQFETRRQIVNLKFLRVCLKVIESPMDTQSVFLAPQLMATRKRFEESLKHIRSQPGGSEILDQRPKVVFPPLSELAKYPVGTLANEYAKYMTKMNLDPDVYDVDYDDEVTYVFHRYGKLHDIWHIVAGFDSTGPGEIGILGFSYGQTKSPGTLLVAVLVLLHVLLHNSRELVKYTDALIEGIDRGKKTDPVFAVDWNKYLDRQVAELRSQFRVKF